MVLTCKAYPPHGQKSVPAALVDQFCEGNSVFQLLLEYQGEQQ